MRLARKQEPDPELGAGAGGKKEEEDPAEDDDFTSVTSSEASESAGHMFQCHGKEFVFVKKSLNLFSGNSPLRQHIVWFITNVWFDRFILTCIAFNSVILALADYRHIKSNGELDPDSSWRNMLLDRSELVFTIIFTLECILKVLGMGFYNGPGAYLRDRWNWLDFVVVFTGMFVLIPGMPNVSVVRTFRVLRPLRSISAMPGLQTLVISMLKSIPQLMSVIVLLSFIFVLFGIGGLQMFAGASFHSRCRLTPFPVNLTYDRDVHGLDYDPFRCLDQNNFDTEGDTSWSKKSSPWATPRECYWPIDTDDTRLCSFGGGMHKCYAGKDTGLNASDWRWCGSNFDALGNPRFKASDILGPDLNRHEFTNSEVYLQELNYGITNFDNLLRAFLTIFQSITMEGWTDIMYMAQDAVDPVMAAIFFIVLIIFGSFFTLNLLLAVLEDNFDSTKSEKKKEQEEEEKQHALDDQRRMMRKIRSLERRNKRRNSATSIGENASSGSRSGSAMAMLGATGMFADIAASKSAERNDHHQHHHRHHAAKDKSGSGDGMQGTQRQQGQPSAQQAGAADAKVATVATIAPGSPGVLLGGSDSAAERARAQSSPMAVASPNVRDLDPDMPHTMDTGSATAPEASGRGGAGGGDRAVASPGRQAVASPGSSSTSSLYSSGRSSSMRRTQRVVSVHFNHYRRMLQDWVNHDIFGHVITGLIVLNTIVLAMDHHPMDSSLEATLEAINFVLTLMFAMEMVCKLIALGPKGYAKDRFNLFDGFIVITSLVELIVTPPGIIGGSTGDGGAISALRSFRLFRVFKLASKWKSMRILLNNLLRTVVDIANFGLLLLLFMYIFALVGMQFFANRFHFDEFGYAVDVDPDSSEWRNAEVPRMHFDSLLWAFTTVFQILSGENWNNVLYDAWRAAGPWSAIYFLVLIVLGMLIIMNLFLAILLSNFGVSDEEEERAASDAKKNEEAQRDLDAIIARSSPTPDQNGSIQSSPGKPRGDDAAGQKRDQECGSLGGKFGNLFGGKKKVQVAPSSSAGEGDNDDAGGDIEMGARPSMVNEAKEEEGSSASPNRRPFAGHAKVGVADSPPPADTSDDKGSSSLAIGDTTQQQQAQQGQQEQPKPNPKKLSFSTRFSSRFLSHDSPTASTTKSGRKMSVTERLSRATLHRLHMLRRQKDPAGRRRRRTSKPGSLSPREETVFPLAEENALFLFGADNPLRVTCAHIVAHPKFDQVILALIVISSITLALDNPLANPDSQQARALTILDWILTWLFTLEMILKILATGFVMQEKAYLRQGWNVLDFFVVIISLLSLFSSGNASLKALRSLRALRGLRPLRMINRAPGLKVVVNAMFAAIPDVLNVAAVCFLFFLIFSIFAVNYFKGKFKSCQGTDFDDLVQDTDVGTYLRKPVRWSHVDLDDRPELAVLDGCKFATNNAESPTSKQVCKCLISDVYPDSNIEWAYVRPQRFDNVLQALLTLFEISTTEGWVDVMITAVDATDIDMQPRRDAHEEWVWFFMLFMVVGSYLMLNLFVGVVIDNFNRMADKANGNLAMLTEEQQEWVKTQEIAARLRPKKKLVPPPESPIRATLFLITTDYRFEWGIMACIVVNTVIMAMQYFGQPDALTAFVANANLAFAMVFTAEAIMKIGAFGKRYFEDAWNKFDFLIVIGTNIGLVFLWVSGSDVGLIVTIVRTFRIARVFRLVNGAESINQLFYTLILTLPGLGNIAALLFLLFFIFSVMGVQLFATVAFQGAYDEHANFRNFWKAMLVLLRFCTGENWNGLMHDVASDTPGCVDDPEYDDDVCGFKNDPDCRPLNGCGNVGIYPYMIAFTLAVTFIFLNLFIGVILDGFKSADESNQVIKPEDFVRFSEHWGEFDPEATCFIQMSELSNFIQTLYAPLGFGDYVASESELRFRIGELDLQVYRGGRVHFKDVLIALSMRAMHQTGSAPDATKLPEDATRRVTQRLAEKHKASLSGAQTVTNESGEHYTAKHFYAAQTLARNMRRYSSINKRGRESTRSRNSNPPQTIYEGTGEEDAGAAHGGSGAAKPRRYSFGSGKSQPADPPSAPVGHAAPHDPPPTGLVSAVGGAPEEAAATPGLGGVVENFSESSVTDGGGVVSASSSLSGGAPVPNPTLPPLNATFAAEGEMPSGAVSADAAPVAEWRQGAANDVGGVGSGTAAPARRSDRAPAPGGTSPRKSPRRSYPGPGNADVLTSVSESRIRVPGDGKSRGPEDESVDAALMEEQDEQVQQQRHKHQHQEAWGGSNGSKGSAGGVIHEELDDLEDPNRAGMSSSTELASTTSSEEGKRSSRVSRLPPIR